MKATQLSSKPKKEWVGTYVYVAFRPDKIGKIVVVSQKKWKDDFGLQSWTFATIKWPDGTQSDEDVHNLQMIEARQMLHLYGKELVGKVLGRMEYLKQRGNIENPAGFLKDALRVAWRTKHGFAETPPKYINPKRR